MISFFNSFKYAFSGIFHLLRTERNFKIHIFALAVVIVAGFYFDIEQHEWMALLIISAIVLSLEAFNTSLEKLCDLYSTEKNEKIRIIKDIAAGSVLIAVLFSIAIGVLIFGKHLINMF